MTPPVADLPDASHTRPQQFAFLRKAHDGPLDWKAACLSLARQAAGTPMVAPSALAAAHMVPGADRITAVRDLRRGMVLFFDNPTDDNPFGHVVTVAGWATREPTDELDDVVTWSNDAVRVGGVDLVRASFFVADWKAPMLWGSTSVNGYDLPGYGRAVHSPDPVAKHPHIGANLDHAIASVRKALRWHRAHHHPGVVAALSADLTQLRDTRAEYPA